MERYSEQQSEVELSKRLSLECLAFYKLCIALDVVNDLLTDLEANYTHSYFWSMITRNYLESPMKLIVGESYSLLNHGHLAYPLVKATHWTKTNKTTCLVCKSVYPSHSPYTFFISECHKCFDRLDIVHLLESDNYRKFVADLNGFISRGYNKRIYSPLADAFN